MGHLLSLTQGNTTNMEIIQDSHILLRALYFGIGRRRPPCRHILRFGPAGTPGHYRSSEKAGCEKVKELVGCYKEMTVAPPQGLRWPAGLPNPENRNQ